MRGKRRRPILIMTGLLNLLMGLALAVGGVWLIALGGSWYYAIAAAAFLLTGFLLIKAARRRSSSTPCSASGRWPGPCGRSVWIGGRWRRAVL